ncbi:hypothetical protein MUK72_04165 [Halococcus dombrowskii]|uniref:Uncharacterized protein n=1 Tax=Halococcus dombrowskii TaxID=179637 RepID=A0AAV3SJF8_HALDO|nr:hypothetical protein [Halococcus dombrowskii]UOO95908.1 hypothetical protein MUK72_04165 [Halococcus dombrowskii]
MSVAYQIVDVLIAGVVAGLSAFVLSAVTPRFSVTIGVILASMYYFSRNPWGSQSGDDLNRRIDDLYERYLPF